MMRFKAIILTLVFLLFICSVTAEVVVFSDYETHTTVDSGILHIERKITLKNVGDNPIIPGELHFKLHEIKKDDQVASSVTDFVAKNDYGTELKTRVLEGQEETDLVISVWEPVLPKFSYRITLEYDLKFDPKGMLFYELNVPVEETTIPIQSHRHSLYLPDRYHVTYAPGAEVDKVTWNDNVYKRISWEDREDMLLEYSLLPLPKLGIRAVNIFWSLIIICMLVLTFLVHKKIRS